MYRRLKQGGDTIVEVMVCMAVVSAMLGGAFVTARNSQLNVRNSQEHAEALSLIENQVEQLRASGSNSNSPIFTTSPFCMSNGALVSTTTASPAAACILESNGQQAPSGFQPAFTMYIAPSNNCNTPIAQCYQYNVQATWYEIVGNGQGTESIEYRLYQ